MSDKLKGVWIEGRLWENKDFLLVEKHLLQKIHDLDNEHGCTAMNAWFAEFLGISKSRVSQIISKFKRDKLVSVKLKYEGKQVVGRVINVLKGGVLLIKGGVLSANRPLSYTKHPPLAGSEESNIILLNNTISNLRESKKALTQENEDLILKVQKLEAENLELKNKSEAQKEEPKSSAKKVKANTSGFPSMDEFDQKNPPHQIEVKAKYKNSLSKFVFPVEWGEELKESFLTYCAAMNEKSLGKWGTFTQIKLHISDIKGFLNKFDKDTVSEALIYAAKNGNTNYNPQWTLNRKEKEKQDEAKRKEQTDSNGKPLRSKYARFGESLYGTKHTTDSTTTDFDGQTF